MCQMGCLIGAIQCYIQLQLENYYWGLGIYRISEKYSTFGKLQQLLEQEQLQVNVQFFRKLHNFSHFSREGNVREFHKMLQNLEKCYFFSEKCSFFSCISSIFHLKQAKKVGKQAKLRQNVYFFTEIGAFQQEIAVFTR